MKSDSAEISRLKQVVNDLLSEAREQGASSAEAGVSAQQGLSVTVRLGETETIEHTNDHGLGVTVYFGQRKGSANTTDLSPGAIKETVAAACRIARYTSEDPAAGLADAAQMATQVADLDLNHPWELTAEPAADIARECEDAARAADPRINNSEGATLYTQNSNFVYGNSHGFVEGYPTTRHGLSCAILAQQGDDMQRDYWYSSSRLPAGLESAESIGRTAAERTLARLDSRKLDTRECPVLFKADLAPALLRSLIGAVRGHSLYRKASFLLDHLDKQIFPDWVSISEDPHKLQGMASAPFDNEGVSTRARNLVEGGVLKGYVLDSYSARKLEMANTGNAGGVRNVSISDSGQGFDDLLKDMGTGLLVTELMGQGTNMVTGDYSRGAAGFWVENGEIQYPVEEITVASNLKSMFMGLQAVGTDRQIPGSMKTGSWLIDHMMVAGN